MTDQPNSDDDSMERLATDRAKSPESLRSELVRSFNVFERQFRKTYPVLWLITLVGPAVMTAVLLLALGLIYGWEYPSKIVSHALLTFFVFGRFVIILGSTEAAATTEGGYDISMQSFELFSMVTYMDFMVALFVTFHMGVIFRLPFVGEKIATIVSDGKYIMESQPWIRRVAFFGLIVFVIFPTSTTGSIGGSIFGRLLGLGRFLTVTGVLIGSVLGNGLMYVFSHQINQYIDPNNWLLKVAGVLIIVLIFVMLEVRYRRMKNKYFAANGRRESGAIESSDEPA